MDGELGIEDNRQALLTVAARLAAMVGAAKFLPRHLHRAALRLLRPAEWAARRLVIALARGLTPPPARPRKQAARPVLVRNGVGTGIVLPWAARQALRQAAGAHAARGNKKPLALPLFDPLPRRARPARSRLGAPRISVPGATALFALAPRLPPKPSDRLDADRLGRRIAALSAALADLPRQALRYARWSGRRLAAGKRGRRRTWPLRNWGFPGRRTAPDLHALVKSAHSYALWALRPPDG